MTKVRIFHLLQTVLTIAIRQLLNTKKYLVINKNILIFVKTNEASTLCL
jgi:hypothetical protein